MEFIVLMVIIIAMIVVITKLLSRIIRVTGSKRKASSNLRPVNTAEAQSFQSEAALDNTNDSARVSMSGNNNIMDDPPSINSQMHPDELYVRLGSRRVLAIRRPNADDAVQVEEISRQEMAERMARRGMS